MKNDSWQCLFDRRTENTDALSSLSQNELVKILLINRGITNADEAHSFIDAGEDLWNDPFLLKDMDAACARILKAISAHEKIAVYGDYDVDGVTSTAVLINYLTDLGIETEYYIPQRCDEGYGLNSCAIKALYDSGATLLITVDSGITGFEEVKYANSIGLDIIITDHHECSSEIPDALAVINPKRPDCPYPFKNLAGVGVVFKLICALSGKDKMKDMFCRYCELVAIGTIADVMPLSGENRLIAKEGLKHLQSTDNLGLRSLISMAGLESKPINAVLVSFVLAPRINAAGRVGNANLAVELFVTKDKKTAEDISDELIQKNKLRQETEAEILRQVNKELERLNPQKSEPEIIVLENEAWHQGVIGVVASKICERYGCPTILISSQEEPGKGSGRSIGNFNLFRALEKTSSYLEKYGGHELAAGLSIKKENIPAFRKEINRLSRDELASIEMPALTADCELYPYEITIDTINSLSVLEPYGTGNPTPVFIMKNVLIWDVVPISGNKHVRLSFQLERDKFVSAFFFNKTEDELGVISGDRVDIVFTANIHTYRGRDSVQFIIKAMELSGKYGVNMHTCHEIYLKHKDSLALRKDELETIIPVRDDFVATYRYLCAKAQRGINEFSISKLSREVSWHSKREVNHAKMMVCLEVMQENSLINFRYFDKTITVFINKSAPKIDLNDSKILNKLKEDYANA
ncbi:MAG: single-stranded-DNA-specific exonuclease RecJ [Clostridia bacterium]|nr:single-stranded-DNA-specific exonuclease RecJ [Clostridia bacterium]